MRYLASIILVLCLCSFAHAFFYGNQQTDVTYTYEQEDLRGYVRLESGIANGAQLELWVNHLGNISEDTYFPMWIYSQYQDIESWWVMQCGAVASADIRSLHEIKFRCIGKSTNSEWVEINDGDIGSVNGTMIVTTQPTRISLTGTFKGIIPGYYRFGYPISLKLKWYD